MNIGKKINHLVGIMSLLTFLNSIIMLMSVTPVNASEIEDAFLLYSPVFNIDYYSEHYPEVEKMYNGDTSLMLYHFINEGMQNGQQGNEEFSPIAYMNRYSDLKTEYGDNLTRYYLHYIVTGKAEGRNGLPLSDSDYSCISGSFSANYSTNSIEQDEYKINQLINEVLELTNNIRLQNHLTTFTTTPELQRTASVRAQECSVYFSHNRPDSRKCFSAFKENGVTYKYAAENIAGGNVSAQQIVNAWMQSPGHRANILNPKYNHIGIGVYFSTGHYGIYWAQSFTN